MKRALASLILVVLSSVALALPAPKDIEAAVKAGQLSQAETMLHEVIKERPGSAKAHYELGQVLAREGRNQEARKELLEAQRLDPSLKFATDPQRFRDLLNRIPAASGAALTQPHPAATHAAPMAPAETSFPWAYVLAGGGVLIVVWLLLSRAGRAASAARLPMGGAAAGSAAAPGGYGYGPGYGAPGYGGVPQQAPGSGIGGAVLGGIAGMAAGYGLAKVLEHGDESRPAHGNAAADDGFIPIDSGPSSADYGDFDAGTGDGWDAGGSSSGDDNW